MCDGRHRYGKRRIRRAIAETEHRMLPRACYTKGGRRSLELRFKPKVYIVSYASHTRPDLRPSLRLHMSTDAAAL